MAQAVQRTHVEDYGGSDIPVGTSSAATEVSNNIQKYLIHSSTCGHTDAKCDTSVFPLPKGSGYFSIGNSDFLINNYKTLTGNAVSGGFINDGIMALADGATILFDYDVSDTEYNAIGIDVNGWRKRPNKYGIDVFGFYLYTNGQLVPMNNTAFCVKTGGGSTNGLGCTAQALSDKDYFKNLP